MNTSHPVARAGRPSGRHLRRSSVPAALLAVFLPLASFAQLPPAASPADASLRAGPAGEVVTLSPFEVNTDKDDGFTATNAGTATKLGLDLKDMAAPYSVMTGEFIAALGITDLQEAVAWSTNGGPVVDAQGADQFAVPAISNVRGQVLVQGQQRNFFTTASISDTYNAERIDFGRGPNAVLFNTGANSGLGGGISVQTKRARTDRDIRDVAFTVGSWDYFRTTVDFNEVISDKLALRLNALWQERGGYMDHEFDDRRGVTLAATYRPASRTEVRLEVSHESVSRTRPTFPSFDRVSGWNGTSVFDGPITNAMLSGTATPGAVYGLTFSGSPQGVERVGNEYVYVPGQGMVMNWVHTARTRRGDENSRVPIYSGGQVWTRNGNDNLLSFGNWATQMRPPTPDAFRNGAEVPFRWNHNLPDDRFDRALANSNLVLPGKTFTNVPAAPLYEQEIRSAGLGFTHQFSDRLFFEASGNANSVEETIANAVNGYRHTFIDLNRNLPNGTPNPNFLEPYGQDILRVRARENNNAGLRASLNYIHDLGRWGHYTFNLTGAYSYFDRPNRQRRASVALAADPREWQSQVINVRNYWNATDRSFPSPASLPGQIFNRIPDASGNSYTTTAGAYTPRWVLDDWFDEKETQRQLIFAMAGKYFSDRLVLSGGFRYDNWERSVRQRPTSYGFLPVDPSWDGFSLDDRYWRADAPADWKTLTYVPKNADGTPRSATPVLAINRPTTAGVNGVNPANPLYANDRFRSDYSSPARSGSGVNTYLSAMYHPLSWLSVGGSYGDSYKPRTGGELTLVGDDAEPETGVAYDGVLRFNLLRARLGVSARYYFNRNEDVLGTPPTTSPINALLARNAFNDNRPESRNQLGYQDVLGGDYFARKNSGIEIEVSGRITKGWRLTGSFGTGRIDEYQRWQSTQAYVTGRQAELREVLEAAGGALDTTTRPANAPSAPGLAIANPALSDTAIIAAGGNPSERANAVLNYNNIWVQFDTIPLLQDTIGIKRITAKVFTDYTFQEGRLKGLRVGLGANWTDQNLAGYRSGDTVANPSFNPAQPVTATNRPWMDDPDVDLNTPVWIDQPFEVTGTLGYTWRLKSGFRALEGKEISFNLVIRNLTNRQKIIHQDEGVALRPPDGDFSLPNRVAVPSRIGLFQRPINYEFTTTVRF